MTLRKDGDLWGRSSIGRAPALQAGGRGIVTLHFHMGTAIPGEKLQAAAEVSIEWETELVITKHDISNEVVVIK